MLSITLVASRFLRNEAHRGHDEPIETNRKET